MLNPRRRRAAARGLSIVEVMVGVAIGLTIVAASVSLSGQHIAGARQLMSEIRVNQDLRAVAELVTRDLRRAAYWDNAILGTQASATGSATTPNPYAAVTAASGNVTYSFTRDATEDNTLGNAEQFGFRLTDGRIEMQTASGTWQAITDPGVLSISEFTITPTAVSVHLGGQCPTPCAVGAPNCPTITLRSYELTLRGRSVRDSQVERTLRSTVRVRNDRYAGTCPA